MVENVAPVPAVTTESMPLWTNTVLQRLPCLTQCWFLSNRYPFRRFRNKLLRRRRRFLRSESRNAPRRLLARSSGHCSAVCLFGHPAAVAVLPLLSQRLIRPCASSEGRRSSLLWPNALLNRSYKKKSSRQSPRRRKRGRASTSADVWSVFGMATACPRRYINSGLRRPLCRVSCVYPSFHR